jgi:hypothetical protein
MPEVPALAGKRSNRAYQYQSRDMGRSARRFFAEVGAGSFPGYAQ